MKDLLLQLLKNQQPCGGFTSVTECKGRYYTDVNAFFTAQIVQELLKRPDRTYDAVLEKATGFLRNCASLTSKGAFNFYPLHAGHPPLIPLPDDADDTAIISLIMLRTGCLSRADLMRNTCVLFDKYRVKTVDCTGPPWIRTNAFYTWLDTGGGINVVDCCVNSNIIALYAYAGLQHLRGYTEACAMIYEALQWAGRCDKRLLSITPFYSSAAELYFAVEWAVAMGASELSAALHALKWIRRALGTYSPNRGICGSAYGRTRWYCPLLQYLRKISP